MQRVMPYALLCIPMSYPNNDSNNKIALGTSTRLLTALVNS